MGTQKATSVNKLFSIISKILKYKKPVIYQPQKKGELLKSYLCIEKIKKELGWYPKFSLQEGIEKTINYFKYGKI